MTRQTLVSSLAIFVLGTLGVACKSGGVGDPCIPNLEYSATDPGAVETGAQIEDRSFQCETRVCLVNHFRGRVTCPWGNELGGSKVAGAECLVPGTDVRVAAGVKPNCRERKDYVYCSCRCAGDDAAAKYCECPSGYVCDTVTNSLDKSLMRPNDKYCVLDGNNSSLDSKYCCDFSNGAVCSDRCDTDDMCGFESNRQKF
jgi:hypothetical protein